MLIVSKSNIVYIQLTSTIANISQWQFHPSDYFLCKYPCGVYLLQPLVRDLCLQISGCEQKYSMSFLYTQCKQDAKKRTLAYVAPLRVKGFKSIYFFSSDMNSK